MKTENNLNKIILAGMFLALSSLLIIIQIPIFLFLKLDLSLVPILIAEVYIGFYYVVVIGILSPLMVIIVYGDPVGALFLILLNIVVITFNHFFYNRKQKGKMLLSSLFIVIITSLIVSLLNMFIFVPLFYGVDYIQEFATLWLYWIIIIVFNLIKLIIVYMLINSYFYYSYKKNNLNIS